MFYRKQQRIEYLGFDDFWFKILGIFILSLVMYFLYGNAFDNRPLFESVINWSVSLVFSISDWLIIRWIMILLRKKYPQLKDNAKRITFLFFTIVATVILVDFIGLTLLSSWTKQTYSLLNRSRPILAITLVSTMTMAIYEAIYFYVKLKESIREEEQSKQVMVQAQLDALRNQAQPHFFFNTLNTLRDIIDQNAKEDAMEFVDKLSDVYRFILETGDTNLITLKNEIRFAEAYLHIQSERFDNNLKLKWDVPKRALNKMIVPMSLQLLLENAIKHNVVSKAKPLIISIVAEENRLRVSNKLQLKSTRLPSTKLGLKNINKRFTLIANRAIEITRDENEFAVSLPLLNA